MKKVGMFILAGLVALVAAGGVKAKTVTIKLGVVTKPGAARAIA